MKSTMKRSIWLILLLMTGSVAYAAAGWPAPTTVDTEYGAYPSMTVVSGNPAISYYYYTSSSAKGLHYVQATNSTGTAWGSHISILGLGSQGGYLSMEIVNGRPAISYYQDSGGVWYVRANDADGSSWPTTSTIINVGPNHDNYVSLAIVNGFPSVSYYGGTSNLTYTRATDGTGIDANGRNAAVNGRYFYTYRQCARFSYFLVGYYRCDSSNHIHSFRRQNEL